MTAYQAVDGSVVRDFAERTLRNLEFIEDHYHNAYRTGESSVEVYEITQMINSLLGLLVFPKEEFWGRVKPVPLEQVPLKMYQRGRRCSNLRQVVRYLRNGISHFNVHFRADADYIDLIEIWNEWEGEITWQAEMSVFDLREFAIYFIEGIIDGSLLRDEERARA